MIRFGITLNTHDNIDSNFKFYSIPSANVKSYHFHVNLDQPKLEITNLLQRRILPKRTVPGWTGDSSAAVENNSSKVIRVSFISFWGGLTWQ